MTRYKIQDKDGGDLKKPSFIKSLQHWITLARIYLRDNLYLNTTELKFDAAVVKIVYQIDPRKKRKTKQFPKLT